MNSRQKIGQLENDEHLIFCEMKQKPIGENQHWRKHVCMSLFGQVGINSWLEEVDPEFAFWN